LHFGIDMNFFSTLPRAVGLLSESERSRLQAAIDRYTAILMENAQQKFDSQTPRERMIYALNLRSRARPGSSGMFDRRALIRDYREDPEGKWWETARLYASMQSGGPHKSALLLRLLQDKPHLPLAPPCSHNLPWYSLIDEPGAHFVTELSLGDVMPGASSEGSQGRPENEILAQKGINWIFINQTLYAIIDANQAGVDLLCAVSEMINTPDSDRLPSDDVQDDLNVGLFSFGAAKTGKVVSAKHPLMPAVLDAYARDPQIMVKHGQWPVWRLFIGPHAPASINAKWAADLTQNGPFSCTSDSEDNQEHSSSEEAVRGLNPLDLAFRGLHAKPALDQSHALKPAVEADIEFQRIAHALRGKDPRKIADRVDVSKGVGGPGQAPQASSGLPQEASCATATGNANQVNANQNELANSKSDERNSALTDGRVCMQWDVWYLDSE
jgi:hypothetical protein